MNEDAQKEVKKATDALDKAKKDIVESAKVENAQKNAKKAQEETEKALKKYQDAKKKLDSKISSIKKNVGSPSPSHTIPPPPMSYPAYSQPAPFVSQMLNPNYANPYSSYQRGPRRMY